MGWLKRNFNKKRLKPQQQEGAAQDDPGGNSDEADPSFPSTSGSPAVRTTSIQSLFPRNNIYGLRDLYIPAKALVDIIFLHGLTGRADKSFLHEETGIYWPFDLLPKDIPDARIFSFGYDADVTHLGFGSVGQNTLQNHAQNLLHDLARKRSDDQLVSYPYV